MRVRARVPRDAVIVSGLVLVTAVLSFVPLWRLTGNYSNDIIPHAKLAVEYVESGHLFTYSLWYPLIWTATAGGNAAYFRIASVGLLVVFVVAKALVAYVIAQRVQKRAWSSALIAFGVTFFGPLIDPSAPNDIYLGQISSTVWHNSTNIAVAPFALVAFWAAMRLVAEPAWRPAIIAGVATAFAIAVKPNFGIAMIPVVGVAVLVRLVQTRADWRRGLAVIAAAAAPPLVILVVQYASVFGGGLDREESLTIAPLAAWEAFSDNIPRSLLLSLLGVAVVLVLLIARREPARQLLLAWAVLAVAILQLSLFAERLADGSLAQSGNWFWGAYTALMVVVLWSAMGLRKSITRVDAPRRRAFSIFAVVMLGLHVAAGIYYGLSVGTPAYGAF